MSLADDFVAEGLRAPRRYFLGDQDHMRFLKTTIIPYVFAVVSETLQSAVLLTDRQPHEDAEVLRLRHKVEDLFRTVVPDVANNAVSDGEPVSGVADSLKAFFQGFVALLWYCIQNSRMHKIDKTRHSLADFVTDSLKHAGPAKLLKSWRDSAQLLAAELAMHAGPVPVWANPLLKPMMESQDRSIAEVRSWIERQLIAVDGPKTAERP